MSLLSRLKQELTVSMKEKNETKKGIIRVVLGEVSRHDKVDDQAVEKIIRKLIQSNQETLGYLASGSSDSVKLADENVILDSFIPKALTREQIMSRLHLSSSCIVGDVKSAKSDGQAIGLLMKYFKQRSETVLGDDIKSVAEELRKS